MQGPAATLLTRSAEHRRRAYRGRSLGLRQKTSTDAAAVLRACRVAAALAAAERERHGRPVPEADREDASAALALDIYGVAGDTPPTLADVTDPDRPTLPTADGERVRPRPNRELVKRAGSYLDGMRHEHETALAALGGLLEQSAWTRERAAERRREVWADPTADPCPPELASALDGAGVWPGDPLRLAATDAVLSTPPAAEDWTLTPTGAGKSVAAILKARQRGAARLAAGAADSTVATLGRLLADAITPTPAEHRERERVALAALAAAGDYGPRKAAPRPDGLRQTQPLAHPITYRIRPGRRRKRDPRRDG